MPSAFPPGLHIAIVGGGLGGIALAIALKKRGLRFTIYESKGAFTEIGAGINLAPNGLSALRAIDPALGDNVYALATRNQSPNEETWMWIRYGAPSGDHADGETVIELKAPPTGNMALHRQELLKSLADHMGHEHARFNKKLVDYEQDEKCVKLKFADGTEDTADVLVGCDGIHSKVRKLMYGNDNPVSKPHFNQDGVYRAVIPIEKAVEAWGETARQSQFMLGPNGYLIYYPVNGGTDANVGLWSGREGKSWDHSEWVLSKQGENFQQDNRHWGPRVHKMLAHFDQDPAFWAAHAHKIQPDTFTVGRVILIGDGAHSMPPHQGAGASQAIEDAYVLAEILSSTEIHLDWWTDKQTMVMIEAALQATGEIRKARSSQVQQDSFEAGRDWHSFYDRKLEGEELEAFKKRAKERVEWIWNVDMLEEGEKAKRLMKEFLSEQDWR